MGRVSFVYPVLYFHNISRNSVLLSRLVDLAKLAKKLKHYQKRGRRITQEHMSGHAAGDALTWGP